MKQLIVLMVLFCLTGLTSCHPEALSEDQKTESPYSTGDELDDPVEPDREDN